MHNLQKEPSDKLGLDLDHFILAYFALLNKKGKTDSLLSFFFA
jgi:hypothetical protein